MPSFLFAFALVLLTSIGSRDQVLLADLSARLGRHRGALLAGWIAAVLSAAAMAWAGSAMAAIMPDAGANMLVALALAAACFELAWPNRVRKPAEPTRSLGAVFLVLLARQIGDAPRFLVFAVAVATGVPWLAGFGGAAGGAAALALGWAAGAEIAASRAVRPLRIALAVIAGVAAIVIGLSARGLVG